MAAQQPAIDLAIRNPPPVSSVAINRYTTFTLNIYNQLSASDRRKWGYESALLADPAYTPGAPPGIAGVENRLIEAEVRAYNKAARQHNKRVGRGEAGNSKLLPIKRKDGSTPHQFYNLCRPRLLKSITIGQLAYLGQFYDLINDPIISWANPSAQSFPNLRQKYLRYIGAIEQHSGMPLNQSVIKLL